MVSLAASPLLSGNGRITGLCKRGIQIPPTIVDDVGSC